MRKVPIAASAASARAMNPATSLSGSEISCDDTAPISRFASGIVSRMRQIACRCASDAAITPSLTSPASSASA